MPDLYIRKAKEETQENVPIQTQTNTSPPKEKYHKNYQYKNEDKYHKSKKKHTDEKMQVYKRKNEHAVEMDPKNFPSLPQRDTKNVIVPQPEEKQEVEKKKYSKKQIVQIFNQAYQQGIMMAESLEKISEQDCPILNKKPDKFYLECAISKKLSEHITE